MSAYLIDSDARVQKRAKSVKFRIEKGVPLPSSARHGATGRPEMYPWAYMQPGDSFLIRTEDFGSRKRNNIQKQIGITGRNWAKRRGITAVFATRSLPEGIRCWRVS